jgi:flagellar biosynthesis anti-sigma factor FlgM
MFPLDLPIETTRLISLAKLQKSTQELHAAAGREARAKPQIAPERMERVASLRKAIAEGTYRISAADIAEKIIAHMLTNRPTIH